jgi:hypothetical protein
MTYALRAHSGGVADKGQSRTTRTNASRKLLCSRMRWRLLRTYCGLDIDGGAPAYRLTNGEAPARGQAGAAPGLSLWQPQWPAWSPTGLQLTRPRAISLAHASVRQAPFSSE